MKPKEAAEVQLAGRQQKGTQFGANTVEGLERITCAQEGAGGGSQ